MKKNIDTNGVREVLYAASSIRESENKMEGKSHIGMLQEVKRQ
jgi:hypothetical protein